jgi:hypothetical protein
MKTQIGVLPMNLNDFDNEQAAYFTCSNMTYKQGMKQDEKIAKPTNPSILKDASKNWLVWKEGMEDLHFPSLWRCFDCPVVCLSYPRSPNPKMYNKVYRNEDDRFDDLNHALQRAL